VLLLTLLTAAGGALYAVDHYLDKINKIDPDDDYIVPPENEDFETDDGLVTFPSSSMPDNENTSSGNENTSSGNESTSSGNGSTSSGNSGTNTHITGS
jgi:hypothetical protein